MAQVENTEKAKAEAKAEDIFRTAERIADEQGLIDAQKYSVIAGFIQEELAHAYSLLGA